MVATTFSTIYNLVTDLVRKMAFLAIGRGGLFCYWDAYRICICRLWHRSGVLTDIEFYELRYGGKRLLF